EEKGDTITIQTKHNNMRLKTLSYEDFPTIPAVQGESVNIPATKLIEGITSVMTSASLSDIKPEIASVFMYAQDRELIFVATDSFRLAEKRISTSNVDTCPPVIIPIKNAVEISRIFEHSDTEVTLTFSDNQLSLVAPGITVSSRVVNGTFPD